MRRAALAAGVVALVRASLRREEPPAAGENAPETQPALAMDVRFKCDMCGYIYSPEDGIPAGSDFDNLPDTWTCPHCGATKQMFKLMNTSQGGRWVHAHSPGPTPASGTLDLPATSFGEIASHSDAHWRPRDERFARPRDGDRDPSREKWKYPTKFGVKTGKWLLKHLKKEKSDLLHGRDNNDFLKLHPDVARLKMHFLNGLQKMAKTYNLLVSNDQRNQKSIQRWQKAKEHVDWYDRVDETALRGDFDRVEELAEKHPHLFQEKYGNQNLDWPPLANGVRADSEGLEYSEGNEGHEDSEDN